MGNKNPYTSIVSLMREQGSVNNPPTMGIGEVKSTSPLTISINDLTLYEDDLYINSSLLDNYDRQGSFTSKAIAKATGRIKTKTKEKAGGSGTAEYESHYHDIEETYEATVELTDFKGEIDINNSTALKAGDLVALIPDATKSRYIVLCKVVILA